MSDETGAIVVRKDVMDKFHGIMAETKLEANELMEHFFGLYHCCVKLVQPLQRDSSNMNAGVTVKNEFPDQSMQDEGVPMEADTDVSFMGCSMDQEKQKAMKSEGGSSGTGSGVGSTTGLISSLTSLANQGTLSDPVLAFQSLLALYRRDENTSVNRRKAMPKRIIPSNYNPTPCETKPEDVLKRVMCSLCQATFERFTDLLAHHKNTHNADLSHPLRCRACGRTQTSEAGLVHHQIYVCKMVERPFTCEVCTLKFQSEEMVWVHKCSGDTRKRFACEFCDHYRTESASDLEKHMRIHTGDKCFRCQTCGFQTAWKKNLKEHMLKHSGLKPYVCDYCGYSTADKHNLRAHRLKHGKEEGFDCSLCGLSFSCYRSLRQHKESHNHAEKPFKCSGCDYRAKYKSVLHLHQVRHNHLPPLSCDVCGGVFPNHKELQEHRLAAHSQGGGGEGGEVKPPANLTPASSSSSSTQTPSSSQTSVLSVPSAPHNHQQHLQQRNHAAPTPQLHDATLLQQQPQPHHHQQQQQQGWKGGRADSLTQTGQTQTLMTPSSLAGFPVQQGTPNVAVPSFGAGVLSSWPGGMGGNMHDFFGARMALGQNPNDSLLRQTAALSQSGAQTLTHPSSFVACPLPVFPGLGEQLPGGSNR